MEKSCRMCVGLAVLAFALPAALMAFPPRGDDGRARARIETPADRPDAETLQEVRGTLGGILKHMALDGSLKNVIGRFSEPDRKRVGSGNEEDVAELERATERFNNSWRANYGSNFHFGRIFGYGESKKEEDVFKYSFKQSADKRSVSLIVDGSGYAKPYELRLVNEGRLVNHWTLDAPDSLTARSLKDGMVLALESLSRDIAAWPANEIEGYRYVARRMFEVVGTPGSRTY